MSNVRRLGPAGGAPGLSKREVARINELLERLDPRVGEPGSVPGEIVLSRGREAGPLAA